MIAEKMGNLWVAWYPEDDRYRGTGKCRDSAVADLRSRESLVTTYGRLSISRLGEAHIARWDGLCASGKSSQGATKNLVCPNDPRDLEFAFRAEAKAGFEWQVRDLGPNGGKAYGNDPFVAYASFTNGSPLPRATLEQALEKMVGPLSLEPDSYGGFQTRLSNYLHSGETKEEVLIKIARRWVSEADWEPLVKFFRAIGGEIK